MALVTPITNNLLPRPHQTTAEVTHLRVQGDLPSSNRDELFFHVQPDSGKVPPPYLIFEPVLSSVILNHSVDWRRYEPPKELFSYQENISEEIESLLLPSVERFRASHAEELARRASSLPQGRPLARGRRASVRPQNIVTSASQDVSLADTSRYGNTSNLSIDSSDSGSASMLPDGGPRITSKTGEKSIFGLSSILRLRARGKEQRLCQAAGRTAEQQKHQASPPPEPEIESASESRDSSRRGECVSCLDDFAAQQLIELQCHSYCMECFKRFIRTSLESETHWPAKCCLNIIPSTIILPLLDSQTKKKYKQRQAEWSIPAGDRIYCAHCSIWIPPKLASSLAATCPKCAKKSCTICRGAYHTGSDCPQDPNIRATIELADMEGWKRCYSCHALVEHNQGCRHMTCRCKAQFCYICGQRWRTCACTDVQSNEIRQLAMIRRHEQNAQAAQTAAAAEEERALIEEVTAFVRAEEEREVREAQARVRIQEEERRRREEQCATEISRRYHDLRTELEILHDMQRFELMERYGNEKRTLKDEQMRALDVLIDQQSNLMRLLQRESQEIISGAKQRLDEEYRYRLAEERRIEDDYVKQLQDYWKNAPEAAYKIREARNILRADQDKEYNFWNEYRRKQLQAVSERERRRMESLVVRHQSEVTALEGRCKIDEVEWQRKKSAEEKWEEEVFQERYVMLRALEQAQ